MHTATNHTSQPAAAANTNKITHFVLGMHKITQIKLRMHKITHEIQKITHII